MKSSRIAKGKRAVRAIERVIFLAVTAFLSLGLLTGASCKKESTAKSDPRDVIAAADAARKGSGGSGSAATPLDRTPVAGVDVSKLEASKQDRFYQLMASLPSPCGKAHSLRTSVASDPSCKRAPYAARLVAELLADEQSDDVINDFFQERYVTNNKVHVFDIEHSPQTGSADAPVTLVEFFDYGCPMCVQMKPVLDEVIKENPGKLRVIYKMFPLIQKHPDSYGCAQAALAAQSQGKFHQMHDLIFEKYGNQKKDDLRKYAEQVELDMARYDADLAATEALIKADQDEGQDNGVDGTPTIFLNGRKYPGPSDPRYFAMAIDEEIAARH